MRTDSPIWSAVRGGVCCVLGFGVSGKSLIGVLLDHGAAKVRVYDKKTPEELGPEALALAAQGVEFYGGEAYLATLAGDVIFRSPGFKPWTPEIAAAVAKGAILSSEMELFMASTEACVIGVTGSDGKTTTTTLTSLLLEQAVKARGYGKVYLGGNIGTPLMPLAHEMTPDDFAVVELSSFQLSTMQDSPRFCAVTNVTPNHLDWHPDMQDYTNAKCHIWQGNGAQRLVTNRDNAVTYEMAGQTDLPVTLFSGKLCDYQSIARAPGDIAYFLKDGYIVRADGQTEQRMLAVSDVLLPGAYNLENYMTAIALTEQFITPEMIREVATTFKGVAHRFEFVREKDGVRYYNSSIDSTPSRTAAALSNIAAGTAWVICGGYDKKVSFLPLAKVLRERAKGVVLTGATADLIEQALAECLQDNPALVVLREADFTDAVRCAASHAGAGEIVLLSPACASFDAFKDYKQRGETFRRIVNEL